MSSGQPCPCTGIKSQRCTSSICTRPTMPMFWMGPPRCSLDEILPCTLPVWPSSSALISPRPLRSSVRSRSTRSGARNQRPFRVNDPRPCAGRSVRAGLPVSRDVPRVAARSGRRDIEVGLHQVEDRFGIAEFEVDTAVAHVNGRRGAHHRAIHKGEEIPVAGIGLRQIDVRAFQADGVDDEAAAQQRPDARGGPRSRPCRRWAQPMEGSSWITTSSAEKPGPLKRLNLTA